ncbi:hypothetical protein [Nostoc sp. PCC 9305]|uniref:hypothetical protein n=1 Tax=Nostoc sp. PCC 9305 TaxID=296636 RepID=UPI0039C71AD0
MGVVLILQIVKNFVSNFERRLDTDFRRPVFGDLELERTSTQSKLRLARCPDVVPLAYGTLRERGSKLWGASHREGSHREAIIRY